MASNARRRTSGAEGDLLQSLNNLTLSTADAPSTVPNTTAQSSSRPTSRPTQSRSSSALSNHDRLRTPRHATPPQGAGAREPSSPNLLRKASMNSLHSASGAAPGRRTSTAQATSPTLSRTPTKKSPPPESIPERPPVTANSVARESFEKELEAHHGEKNTIPTDLVVVLHDACYGHRFSRPKTSKNALSTIVERPERIRASVLGVAAAYVRLGERHEHGDNAPHPNQDPAVFSQIPFRIHKTQRRTPLLSPAVTNVHGTKWMEELKLMCETAEAKLAMNGKELQRPSDGDGDGEPAAKFHEGDLYLCSESLAALEGSLGAVCDAVDRVFQPAPAPKRAFVAIRPPGHHCSASFPSGFCWINNVHVGIMHGILAHGLTHAAIIDFDLHHGDGSQAIAWQHNSRGIGATKNAAWWKKTSIGYFSLHDINSYPCEMGDEEKVKNASLCIDNAHGQNIWNVHLEPWKTEQDFWRVYESKYMVLLEKTRKFLREHTARLRASTQNSKAAIFFSAGFDASEWEGAGMQRHSVNVPTGFYARIARDVIKIAEEEGTSVDGRVISVLEGGYSDRALTSGVLSHVAGLAGEDALANQVNGIKRERSSSLGGVELLKSKPLVYDTAWWHASELEKLEPGANLAPPPAARSRVPSAPTYFSPTQASLARVSPAILEQQRRRQSSISSSTAVTIKREPTPPPPEVPWHVATQALCDLLIPTTRTTTSCRHEELTAEATRIRREKVILATAGSLPSADDSMMDISVIQQPMKMSLRDRRLPVKPNYAQGDLDPDKNRRRTVAGPDIAALAQQDPMPPINGVKTSRARPPSRRVSTSSALPTEKSLAVEQSLASAVPQLDMQSVSSDSRPATAMSSNSVTGATPARKPRAPAAKPAAPRGRKTPAATPAKSRGRPPSPRKKTTSSTLSVGGAAAASDPVDNLTSSVKKIKLNVVPRAQRIAAEQAAKGEHAEHDGGAALTTPVATPASEPLAAPLGVYGVATTPTTSAPSISATPAHHDPVRAQPSANNIPSSGPRTPTMSSPMLSSSPLTGAPTYASPDVFIPFQPEGPDQITNVIPQAEQLRWLEPNNIATPSPMKRTDLPRFTATSAIPFAFAKPDSPAAAGTGSSAGTADDATGKSSETKPEMAAKQSSVHDVPDTPHKTQ